MESKIGGGKRKINRSFVATWLIALMHSLIFYLRVLEIMNQI